MKKIVERLTDIISMKIYYKLYRIIFNFQQSLHLHCFCLDIPGCYDEVYGRNYCLICQFYWNFDLEDLEKGKQKPLKLIGLCNRIKIDLYKINKYDNTLSELWCNYVSFTDKWTRNVTYLEDFIEFLYFAA